MREIFHTIDYKPGSNIAYCTICNKEIRGHKQMFHELAKEQTFKHYPELCNYIPCKNENGSN